ncbi:MAG: TPM domain-containing protein [bacterium]|nr:TPM domain-containing protein [bacterium]
MHGTSPSSFFSKEEREEIRQAIAAAEQKTSGEVRVHLVHHFKKGKDPLEAGKEIFEAIGMTATAQRNGVLFLLELKHHQLVILGDQGIHERVPENFWEEIRDEVLQYFKKGDFSHGLSAGIRLAGEQLKEFFPLTSADENELPDELSFS